MADFKWRTLMYIIALEFTAQIAYSFCVSRMGQYTFLSSSFATFLVLIVFRFPYLNPYFNFFLNCSNIFEKYQKFEYWDYFRKIVYFILISASQIAASFTAAHIRKNANMFFGPQNLDAQSHSSLLLTNVTSTNADMSVTWFVIEEMFAVSFLLVGICHIQLYTVTVSDTNKNFDAISNILQPAKEAKVFINNTNINFIPIEAIFYVSVLYACISYMYPTAHTSASMTMYWWTLSNIDSQFQIVNLDKNEHMWRVLGGCAGTVFAIVYQNFTFIYLSQNKETEKLFTTPLDSKMQTKKFFKV